MSRAAELQARRMRQELAAARSEVERLNLELKEERARTWIQCTTRSNKCLGGCANQKEHDRYHHTQLMAENERLRRELDEARADISVLRDDRDRIRTVSAEALALRDRLSTIVDEAFGPQEVLPLSDLLARLEHLLTERARQHEEVRRERERLRSELAEMTGCATHWCAEGGRSEREHRETLIRCRTAAQILIAEIGAGGPESVEETARRAVAMLQSERGQRKADLLQDLAEVTVALRDLINSLEATKCRDTIVLRDLDAARAVLGGRS